MTFIIIVVVIVVIIIIFHFFSLLSLPLILFLAPFFINQFIHLFICIYSFIYSYVHLNAHVMHSWHSCIHQRILLITETDLGLISLHGFLLPLSCIYFTNHSLILCCLIINLLFFFFFLITKLAFCLLFYICHLGPCFGPGHCCPFRNPTLVDFICCWIAKWVTGVCLRNRVPSPGSWSLGHVPFVVLICFLATCHTDMYQHLFVLMIGQLLYKNSDCMAIKIF